MPNQNHIEVIDRFDRSLREGTATGTDVDGMDQSFDDMYNNGTADVRGRLARLRGHIDRVAQGTATSTEVRTSLQRLRDTMDRNFVAASNPEGGLGSVLQAGANRFTLFERENLPSDPRFNTASRWALRGTLAAGATLVVGTAGYLVWNYVLRPVTNALGSIGTAVVGLGTSIGATMAAFSWMPQSWRDTIRNSLPSWMRGANTSNQTPQDIKKLEEQRQKQEGVTDNASNNARFTPDPQNARLALTEIQTELQQIQSLPADRQTLLAQRRTTLENLRREMRVITGETQAEVLQAVTNVINALDTNISNLLNPPTEREVAGVRIRFEGSSILLDGRRLVIEASRSISPWLPVTLNTLRRSGANLQANATATILGFDINRTPVFTPAKIAEAINRYKDGGLPYEEDETDANNRPTGVRLKFSLAAAS